MTKSALVLLLASVTFSLPVSRAFADSPDQWVLPAMAAELNRSRAKLRLEGYDPAYYTAYAVRDLDRYYAMGKAGALFQSNRTSTRFASADCRVGDYSMDSSEDVETFSFNPSQKWVPGSNAPIERSETALRRVLWLLTDYKYKGALMSFMQVKGRRVNDPKARTAASMSREDPIRMSARPEPLRYDAKALEHGIRRVTSVLADYPDLFDSSMEVSVYRLTRYFTNTEGAEAATTDDYFQVLVTAMARAEDGMLLDDSVTFYGRTSSDLPPVAEVERASREMAERLVKMRAAPILDPATVPVLMSPEASGVFFHETVGHRLEGHRQNDEEEGRTFKGHLGRKILPEFIDVYDDPTVSTAEGRRLNGSYAMDDEGVAARRAVLVEKGVLRGFLMSRRPVEGAERSNGHGRSDGYMKPVGRMGNLFIRGVKPVSSQRLREMLLEEVRRQGKPYGLYIATIAGGSTNTSTYGYQAFKGIPKVAWRVDAATGKEDLVRGVEIVGTPLSAINKIIATSDRYGVFNGYCGAESGSIPVSTVAPEMLFAEVELQRAEEGKERPPILPPP